MNVYRLFILFYFLPLVKDLDPSLSKSAAGGCPWSEPEPLLTALPWRTHDSTTCLQPPPLYPAHPQNFLWKTNDKMHLLTCILGLPHRVETRVLSSSCSWRLRSAPSHFSIFCGTPWGKKRERGSDGEFYISMWPSHSAQMCGHCSGCFWDGVFGWEYI